MEAQLYASISKSNPTVFNLVSLNFSFLKQPLQFYLKGVTMFKRSVENYYWQERRESVVKTKGWSHWSIF